MRIIPLLLVGFCSLASAEDSAPQKGVLSLTFSERSPFSKLDVFLSRTGQAMNPTVAAEIDYDISKEVFEVYVPQSYDGSVPFGLIVYTSAGKGGGCRYQSTMDRYRMIWIGGANVANEREAHQRRMISLDAVHNMAKRYRIDPRRVYAAGDSGGGRCTSMTAPTFPDVFTGGAIYMCGCNSILLPAGPGSKELQAQIKDRRYAFLTGTNDPNKPGTQSVQGEYKGAGVKYAGYLEVPGMGHDNAPEPWFEKALVFCDSPLVEEAATLRKQAQACETKKPSEAYLLYSRLAADYSFAVEVTADAAAKCESLGAAAEEFQRKELAKIVSGKKPDQLRAFSQTWARLPCGKEARTLANEQGDAELTALLAKGATGLKGSLEKFLNAWEGFSPAERATAEYDKLAIPALAAAQSQADHIKRAKALDKALKGWADCPAVTAANATIDTDLDAALAAIKETKSKAARAQALQAFAKEWQGRTAGSAAQQELEAMVAESAKK